MTEQQEQQPRRGGGARYTQAEMVEAARRFGCASWDVAGIFRQAHADTMTEAEFSQALEKWRNG